MGKVAFIFPGQGSQQVGMGADLVKEFVVAKETFKEADNALDIDVSKLCFEGPAEDLQQTSNTQPAILTASIAVYRVLKEKGIEPDIVAGHSLGEYSALVAAGVLDFTDAVKLVRKRGQLMEASDPSGKGTMAAIIGLNGKEVEAVCQKASTAGIVEPANYNCPGQIVISGEKEGVEKAAELAQEAGAKKAIILNVSGPFHSSLMESAAKELSKELEGISFNDAQVPVVTNVDAEFTTQSGDFAQALIEQISGSVRWEESIKAMIENGVDTFIEVGPGRVLKGFMRRIDRKVTALNVEDLASLEKTLKKL
ncbi:[acyl-carrier-protein] S-malonyltransferase [Orenia metallireducens]|uniref:Malonyl CoA-acyl carrier protein transacylase n=1 Tax=Orenia metallireducens TaxID=1413210 RepID=A0A285HFW5_9FIRM|nr:ACP S-malonyltransferase [Orenia metallireducens]PRX27455.1 [acyl-carrier-protein] S-malonyltransferase [Orenia metallireducens]SNY34547.1 [Acyl-carrier-protein] S-malonyltransferase [Orenia metallireducens]